MRNFIIAKGLVIKWKGAVYEYISRATGTFWSDPTYLRTRGLS